VGDIDAQKCESKEIHDKRYEKIYNLTDYQPGADIQITRRSKYRNVIAPLDPHIRQRGIETALHHRWAKY